MESAGVLLEAFTRIKTVLHDAIDGLSAQQLSHRVDVEANTIGWLAWHLTRVQDDHIAQVAGIEQTWTAAGFADRFALPFDTSAIGYGQNSDDVAAVQVESAQLLIDYHDAVFAQTAAFLQTLTDADLDRVVDADWSPPVTLGVRLVSVISDDLQHAGQAAYVRGLITRIS
jgi:uncharacterized damage-inducible protein DinB